MPLHEYEKELKAFKAPTHFNIPKTRSHTRKVEQRKERSLVPKTKSVDLTVKKKSVVPKPSLLVQKQAVTTKSDVVNPSDLQNIFSILSLLHHRNKNQHRTQKWWKYFSMLRRAVRDLVAIEKSVSSLTARGAVSVRQVVTADDFRQQLARERELEEKRSEVQKWVQEVLLGKCYLAFSTLVADKQFAMLGVALVGILAQIGSTVGLSKVQVEVVTGVSEVRTDQMIGEVVERVFDASKAGTDFGEVVERSIINGRTRPKLQEEATAVDTLRVDCSTAEDGTRSAYVQGASTTEKATKRRKKTNVIDDLFGGLF